MDEQQRQKATDKLEELRVGHGLLSREQFLRELHHGNIEVWALGNDCFALMTWGESVHGKVANILTTVGRMSDAAVAMGNFERLAKEQGAAAVMSVGRPGWTDTVKTLGYDVVPCILMRKIL